MRLRRQTELLNSSAPDAKPGETWDLPPESQYDKEGRPHAILASVVQDVVPGVAIYGSSSKTPADDYGAHKCTVRKDGLRVGGNGLSRPETHFYASKLTYVFSDDLDAYRGQLSSLDWTRVKREVRKALGFGERSAQTAFADGILLANGSWRGEVVRLPKGIEDETDFQYAIVMTSHAHSKKAYWQTVIPLGSPKDPEDPDSIDPFDLQIGKQDWLASLAGKQAHWVASPHYAFTIHQERERISKLGIVVPDEWLEKLEKEFERNWQLPAP